MPLHHRLFLLLACLLTLTLAGAMWGLRLLTADLSAAVDETAVAVGRAVAQILGDELPPLSPPAVGETRERRVIVKRYEHELKITETQPAKPPPPTVGSTVVAQQPVRVLRFELDGPAGDLRLEGAGDQAHFIKVPRSGLSQALERYSHSLWLGAALLLVVGLALAWWLARRIALPLQQLATVARQLGQGELGRTAPETGIPEVRDTIVAFNRMSSQLQGLSAEQARLRDQAGLSELGEVGRGLAHGLRNPLHTIGLSLDALADPDNAEQAAALRLKAREQIRRIDEALKGFLALAAAGASLSEVSDLRVLLEDLLCEASQRSDGRVALLSRLPDGPLLLAIQLQELRAALQAPLVNALEASPDGAIIEVSLSRLREGRVRLEIADRGPGLAPGIRERLFSAHLSHKPEGAGMGLFLAARILKDRYDGSIELLDREGGGTLASIEFGARRDG